ncbi:MAG TPA: hypothetical protein VF043_07745 [Ktedonobacteraceae bacterium]
MVDSKPFDQNVGMTGPVEREEYLIGDENNIRQGIGGDRSVFPQGNAMGNVAANPGLTRDDMRQLQQKYLDGIVSGEVLPDTSHLPGYEGR